MLVSDDSRALQHTAITNFNIMPNTGDFYTTIVKNDTLTYLIDSIYKPHIVDYFADGNKHGYRTKILVRPGDSVLIKIKNNTISFVGKNAANYDFYNQLDSTGTEWAQIHINGIFLITKREVMRNLLKRLQFLEAYVAENNVSDDFEALVTAELQQEYLWNLIGPRSIPFQDAVLHQQFRKPYDHYR